MMLDIEPVTCLRCGKEQTYSATTGQWRLCCFPCYCEFALRTCNPELDEFGRVLINPKAYERTLGMEAVLANFDDWLQSEFEKRVNDWQDEAGTAQNAMKVTV